MSKDKIRTKYNEEDISEIIADIFNKAETPEGVHFKCVHILSNTVMVNIYGKTFMISVAEKSKLS